MSGLGWHRERIVSRWEELQADEAQERELAHLEARRIGRQRAQERMEARIRSGRQWFQVTRTRWNQPTEARDVED